MTDTLSNTGCSVLNVEGWMFLYKSANCLAAGSLKLLTPSPSNRNGCDTSFSRPNRKHPNR
jgi:hypothetical protein